MIRRSDNVAATRARGIVGNGALARLARRVGIARVRPRAWSLYFKGAWGSGSGR